jgi:1-acyl-sn-glycerol-3-phosphate acyltransferase
MSESPSFRPAKPWGWVIRVVQSYIRLGLYWRNRLHLEEQDLHRLRSIPEGIGVILASNHADETDFKVCFELSRRSGRRFLYMMNREAFDEGRGTAGWWLQRLGAFSVERGGQTGAAKRYAIEVVTRGREILVIFPEGEIFYLNDLVQPFKSGAVAIAMEAVVEERATRPDWTAYLMPMAIKYRFRRPIAATLERRIRRMERHLSWRIKANTLQQRLAGIAAELLHRQELAHHMKSGSCRLAELSERVRLVRDLVLSEMDEKYPGANAKSRTQPSDRSWRLSSYLRNLLRRDGRATAQTQAEMRNDLAELNDVGWMGSWHSQYLNLDPSQERLAETVLKLEREVYQIHRPRQLAKRDVFLRIGEPIDMRQFISSYETDARSVRHNVAEQLRDQIQSLIDDMAHPRSVPAGPRGVRNGGNDR